MRAAAGKTVIVAGKIVLVAEGLGAGRVEIEQLLHVEDLDSMTLGLTADNHEVALGPDLAPLAGSGVLRQASKVGQLAIASNLCKSSAIALANGDKLASVCRCPTPGRRSKSSRAAQLRVGEEVIQVNLAVFSICTALLAWASAYLVALEGISVGDGGAVGARNEVGHLPVLRGCVYTGSFLPPEGFLHSRVSAKDGVCGSAAPTIFNAILFACLIPES